MLEVNHSLLSVAEAKNEWSYTSIHPVIIHVACGEYILDKGERQTKHPGRLTQ
jgi:hypothetical protein